MRPLLVVIALAAGCATASYRYPDGEHLGASACLVDRLVPATMNGRQNVGAPGLALYRGGKRVPSDDLVLATGDDDRANDLALRAAREERFGIGSLISGGVLLGAGASLIGFGEDQRQNAALGGGAAITAAAAGALTAGIVLVARAEHDRGRAVLAYNEDAPPGCR